MDSQSHVHATCFLGLSRVNALNVISIGSAVFAGIVVVPSTLTDTGTTSLSRYGCNSSQHQCTARMLYGGLIIIQTEEYVAPGADLSDCSRISRGVARSKTVGWTRMASARTASL